MDLDWSDLLGVALGGAIAAVAGVIQARSGRAAAKEQFDAEVKARRDEEVRVRADASAIEVLAGIRELNRLLQARRRVLDPCGYVYPDDIEDRKLMDSIIAKIESDATFLPSPLRDQVRVVPRLLPRLDEIVGRGFLKERPQVAGRRLLRYAENAVGRWLRNDTALAGKSDSILTYERASEELDNYIDYLADQAENDAQEAEAEAAAEESTT